MKKLEYIEVMAAPNKWELWILFNRDKNGCNVIPLYNEEKYKNGFRCKKYYFHNEYCREVKNIEKIAEPEYIEVYSTINNEWEKRLLIFSDEKTATVVKKGDEQKYRNKNQYNIETVSILKCRHYDMFYQDKFGFDDNIKMGSAKEIRNEALDCISYCKNVKAAIDDIIEHGEDEYPHINNIKPNYYKTNSIYEPFKIIDFYGLDFYSGNVLKYLLRAGKKDDKKEIEDLKKAITYIEKKIELLESKTNE